MPYGLGSADLVGIYGAHGIELAARARVALGETGIWEWQMRKGSDLSYSLRAVLGFTSRIAHSGAPAGAKLCSRWFTQIGSSPTGPTPMPVEAAMQAAQDISHAVTDAAQGGAWRWYAPPRSSTGWRHGEWQTMLGSPSPDELQSRPGKLARRNKFPIETVL